MKKILLAMCLGVGLLIGCGSSPQKQTKKKPKKKLSRVQKMHRKAKVTEALGILGYDGKKIHKQLDKVIDIREKETKDLNNALNDIR